MEPSSTANERDREEVVRGMADVMNRNDIVRLICIYREGGRERRSSLLVIVNDIFT